MDTADSRLLDNVSRLAKNYSKETPFCQIEPISWGRETTSLHRGRDRDESAAARSSPWTWSWSGSFSGFPNFFSLHDLSPVWGFRTDPSSLLSFFPPIASHRIASWGWPPNLVGVVCSCGLLLRYGKLGARTPLTTHWQTEETRCQGTEKPCCPFKE